MKRKRLWVVLVLLAGLGLARFALLRLGPARFTQDMAERIHEGMTEAEVVAVLGRPAGDYHTTEIYLFAPDDYRSNVWINPKGLRRPDGITEKAWISNEGGVAVEFDSKGRVDRSYWEGYWTDDTYWERYRTDEAQSILDRIRRLRRWLLR